MSKPAGLPMPTAALVVYLNVALYACCFMAQRPVLPFLLQLIGAESSSAYGKLQTSFSAIQTLGGLVSGAGESSFGTRTLLLVPGGLYKRPGVLMDKYGAKSVMVVSFAASAAVYGMTAAATSMTLLYASSFPALLQHGVLAARVWISNVCGPEQRAAWLGYIGLAYSLGMVTGPVVGGFVGDSGGPRAPAYLAAWGSVASTLSLVSFLPGSSTTDKAAHEEVDKLDTSSKQRKLSDVLSVCIQKSTRELICVKFLLGCVSGILHTALPLILSNNLQLSVVQAGYIVSYTGLIGFFVHGFLIGFLTKRFSDSAIVRFSCASLLVSYFSLAFIVTIEHLVVVLLPLTVSSFLFETINTAQLTKAVSQQNTGSVLAVDMSISSLSGLVTPMAGSIVLQRHGIRGVGVTCTSIVSIVVGLMFIRGVGAGSSDKKVS